MTNWVDKVLHTPWTVVWFHIEEAKMALRLCNSLVSCIDIMIDDVSIDLILSFYYLKTVLLNRILLSRFFILLHLTYIHMGVTCFVTTNPRIPGSVKIILLWTRKSFFGGWGLGNTRCLFPHCQRLYTSLHNSTSARVYCIPLKLKKAIRLWNVTRVYALQQSFLIVACAKNHLNWSQTVMIMHLQVFTSNMNLLVRCKCNWTHQVYHLTFSGEPPRALLTRINLNPSINH